MKYYLAIDLGATSGRAILSHLENGELILNDIHRFPTGMIQSKDDLVWDIPRLLLEIKTGIKKAFEITNDIVSMSIDSWGVDYVLMDGDKEMPPYYAYRNKRLEDSYKRVHEIVNFDELYSRTGIQFAPFNTIYQLYDDLKKGRLENATDYLTIPQYFIYKLTGVKAHEYTFESTTGLLNSNKKDFDFEIIDRLGLPRKLFPKIENPGKIIGDLLPEVAKEVGGNLKVVLCASHDTGSAFESVDFPKDAVLISSGTWSLLGVKNDDAITTEIAKKYNYTNEGGIGYFRFLKNIMGMWVVNQISQQKSIIIPEICQKLDNISFDKTFNVNDGSLLSPSDMETAVRALLKDNQPKDDLELFASIYHSLAKSYNEAINELESITGNKYSSIYIIGGGAKNKYLNKLVEKYTNRKVVAMPIEATCIGNLKVQIKTL